MYMEETDRHWMSCDFSDCDWRVEAMQQLARRFMAQCSWNAMQAVAMYIAHYDRVFDMENKTAVLFDAAAQKKDQAAFQRQAPRGTWS